MTLQLSARLRSAMLGVVESTVGQSPTLQLISGNLPSSINESDSGTVLVSIDLPADWLTDPTTDGVSKNGSWNTPRVEVSGEVGYYRLYSSDGTCDFQGTVTAENGGGDMELTQESTQVVAGSRITIAEFSLFLGEEA